VLKSPIQCVVTADYKRLQQIGSMRLSFGDLASSTEIQEKLNKT